MGVAYRTGALVGRSIAWLRRRRRGFVAGILVALPFLILLTPLLRDLFFVLPWSVRKGLGWGMVLAAATFGMWRIVTLRPGDVWLEEAPSRPEGTDARVLPWALQLATASLALPMLRHPEATSLGDWDLYLAHFEAARRTLMIWGEFPWWNPYVCGGFPLAANPQVGIFSPGMALVLAFGTSIGLRLATIGWMMLAVEGARRLAMAWLRDPWASALVGLVYGLNGGAMIYAVAGYYIPMSYWIVPWLLLAVRRLGGRGQGGLVLGAWLALAILNSIHYLLIYGVVLAALFFARDLRVRGRSEGGRILRQAVLAVGMVLALCGWRLATTGEVVRDYTREHAPSMSQTLDYALLCWVGRPDRLELARTEAPVFWESNVYVGWTVVILAALSLRWGLRWWHILAGLGFWLAFGADGVALPSYWLNQLPIFRTLHVVSRWRLLAALGVGLAAGSTVVHLRQDDRRVVRRFAAALVLLVGADLVAYGHEVLPLAFAVPIRSVPDPGPPVDAVVQTLQQSRGPARRARLWRHPGPRDPARLRPSAPDRPPRP